jgi:hypothetical protein
MIVAHIMGIPVEESFLYAAGLAAIAPTMLIVMRSRLHAKVRVWRRSAPSDSPSSTERREP